MFLEVPFFIYFDFNKRMYYSCLLLRYASQNSLDESSQKHVPRENGKDKPPYRNHHHTNRAFEVINAMRKYVPSLIVNSFKMMPFIPRIKLNLLSFFYHKYER